MPEFHPDGPHSPGLTREAASQIAELARFLNLATFPADGVPGLADPGDLERVVGSLGLALDRLPQFLGQCAGWLRELAADGAVGDATHPDAGLWARVCASDLEELAGITAGAAGQFKRRAADLSSLYLEGEDD